MFIQKYRSVYKLISYYCISLFIVFSVAACATSGTDFHVDALSKLQPGQTTEAEAATLLGGAPYQKIYNADGTHLLVWSHARVTMGSVQSKAVSVIFDSHGVMIGFNKAVNVPLPVGRVLGIYSTLPLQNGGISPTISSIQAGSLAEKAGWLTGDTIVYVDDIPITTFMDIKRASQKGDRKKTYTLKRGENIFKTIIEFPKTK